MSERIVKGTVVREVQPKPFEGPVTDFQVDKEEGEVLYKVTRQVFNDDGTPKMVEDISGDSADHDEKGNQLFEEDGVTPKSTGQMTNVKKRLIAVYEEKYLKRDQLEIVSQPER